MVIEVLTRKKEETSFPMMDYSGPRYRYTTECRVFYSTHEYRYDGVTFLFGHFKGCGSSLIEKETGAYAVVPQELHTSTVDEAVLVFKKKLGISGLSVHEVVRNFKAKNLDIDLWEISLLIF